MDQSGSYSGAADSAGSGVGRAVAGLQCGTGFGIADSGDAGNLINDIYTGQGQRTYDAENRMKQAWANSQWQTYSYDGDGRRVKRNVNGVEIWQVYGMGGDLLAEYAQNGAAASPQKEYGYRNGQLLITATAGTSWGSPPVLNDNPLVVTGPPCNRGTSPSCVRPSTRCAGI